MPRLNPKRDRVIRGVQILAVEDRILAELMRHDNPREPNRSATVGNALRVVYEQLRREGVLPDNEEIPPGEYEGWAARWRIDGG